MKKVPFTKGVESKAAMCDRERWYLKNTCRLSWHASKAWSNGTAPDHMVTKGPTVAVSHRFPVTSAQLRFACHG
ncbi:hypothetical protein DsansV1_C04g0039191 [Dioscorea sansibarensis]